MKRGPTLLLIKDTKGHIFGGFASHGWEVKPQFQGERSFSVRRATAFNIYKTIVGFFFPRSVHSGS